MSRVSLPMVCAIVLFAISLTIAGDEDRKPMKNPLSDPLDYYGALNSGNPQRRERVEQLLQNKKVDSPKKAEEAALAHHGLQIDAMESFRTNDLFKLSAKVPGFAESDNLAWSVKLVHSQRGVSRVLWVNADTGKVVDLFSMIQSGLKSKID